MNKKPNEEFAKRFRQLALSAQIEPTQAGIAKALRCSKTTAWNYLNGTKLPSMPTAVLIAERFGCCVEYLLTGRGPKHLSDLNEQAALSVISKRVEAGDLLDISNLPEKAKALLQATLRAFDDSTDCPPAPLKSAGE